MIKTFNEHSRDDSDIEIGETIYMIMTNDEQYMLTDIQAPLMKRKISFKPVSELSLKDFKHMDENDADDTITMLKQTDREIVIIFEHNREFSMDTDEIEGLKIVPFFMGVSKKIDFTDSI